MVKLNWNIFKVINNHFEVQFFSGFHFYTISDTLIHRYTNNTTLCIFFLLEILQTNALEYTFTWLGSRDRVKEDLHIWASSDPSAQWFWLSQTRTEAMHWGMAVHWNIPFVHGVGQLISSELSVQSRTLLHRSAPSMHTRLPHIKSTGSGHISTVDETIGQRVLLYVYHILS